MSNLLAKNTLTNYLVVIVKVLQGFLVTRWSIHYLGAENYGLWAVLWTIFAYSLLLDFGFGVAAQKYTATGIHRADISRYNKIISAIFTVHLAMSAVIIAVSAGLSFFTPELFDVHDPERIRYCRTAFLIFAVGSALIFPTSAFPEMLAGLQKLYIRNYINLGIKLIELFGTLAIFRLGGGVICLTFLTLGLALCSNLCVLGFLLRDIPGLRIGITADLEIYRKIGKFSGFVYLVSLSRLVLNRSSRIIISVMCGLPAVGIFHMASRLPEYALLAAGQYQENIKPMIARLSAEKKGTELAKFIMGSIKINLCTGLFFMLPCFFFAPELIVFLFKVDNPEVFFLARLFLGSMLASMVIRQPLHDYLLMADHHKLLSGTVIAEAALNVILDILLVRKFGLGVIIVNSLVIQLALSCAILLPTVLKSLHISARKVFGTVYLRPLLYCIPAGGAAWLFRHYFTLGLNDFLTRCTGFLPAAWQKSPDFMQGLNGFLTAAIGGTLCSGIFILLVYFAMLTDLEKSKLLGIFRRSSRDSTRS